jgi:hypothetical protein
MTKVFSNKRLIIVIGASLMLFSGCASKNSSLEKEAFELERRSDIHTKAYQLKITPIIGTRQDDAKVVMDMGKVLKVWIAPYKDGKTLVSSHDNYVVAQAPDFVIGEKIPKKNWKGLIAPEKKIPFLFRDADLDNAKEINEEEIVKYNNIVYKQQNNTEESLKRLDKANVYDQEIKKFLED